MTRRRSRTEREIPLWLLPLVRIRMIREWGDALYRISVKRTHWHLFNVTVRTRSIRKELAPAKIATIALDTRAGTRKRSQTVCREVPA